MSRCSLRLDESLLDRGSAPFSVGGVSQRSSRSLRSQHSQWHSVSCSESLLFKTPHQVADYSVASDASLISSLLDESSIQESTLIDNLWGLEQDADTRGNALVAEEDCPLISSDSRSSHHRDPRVGMVYLEESSHQGEMKADGEGSVIYCRVVNQEIPEVEESSDSERLIQVEQSLVALWEQVEAAGQRVEQRHNEVLRLYTDLKQQSPSPQRGSGSTEPRVSDLMDLRVLQLHRQLSEERRHREQIRRQDLLLLKMQTTRLDQLELQLQNLAARTWEVQQMQETTTSLPATVRVRMDSRSHDALQAEVKQMEATLGDIRQDVEVLSRCQNGCQQLDTMQQMGSEHVASLIREEIQDVIYGNELTPGRDDGNLPEPLLQWMSRRFISHDDLQEALTSLELNVLQNVSRLLQQQQGDEKTQDAAWHDILKNGNAGNAVTKEEVQRMLSDALRLFSQDRIGLADYALESGGGSILSTRCSETYQTTAALLSLFGVPLWYFSQSPRAVIQPDVHPGNCWAFKGSTGFLVIRLSMSILPTAFTMQHIPKALAPSGMLQSAPRDFSVYGLRDENQEGGKLLGTYTYEENGEDLQTFIISEENDESFQIIEVQVLSNWGHREYTCMYRFRVHGTPRDVWT
uniref:Sad1 and UNC84 domain containing 1 n=1 Tax=Nothobranchius furzeri TaxID=105023 RepID=A0A1A8AAC5_NOTFU